MLETLGLPDREAVGLVGGHSRGSPTFRAQTRPKKHAQVFLSKLGVIITMAAA
jgi:hypothetical protein